jgi:hypothetical protein
VEAALRDRDVYERDMPQRLLHSYCKNHSIRYVDVLADLL